MRRSPGVVPWTPAVGVAGWLLALATAVLVAPVIAGVLVVSGLELDQVSVALIPLAPVVTGLIAVAVAAVVPGSSPRLLFGAGRLRGRWLVLAGALGLGSFVAFNVVLGTAVMYVLQLLGVDVPEVQRSLREAASRPGTLPVVAASTIIAAPLGEELLYRGLIFQSLLSRLRPGAAIWLSAGAFGLGHVTVGASWLSNATLALLIVPLGAVLAWSFRRSGTLWVPILIHAVFNGVTVSLMAVGVV